MVTATMGTVMRSPTRGVYLDKCRHCGGDLHSSVDIFGPRLSCVQCGREPRGIVPVAPLPKRPNRLPAPTILDMLVREYPQHLALPAKDVYDADRICDAAHVLNDRRGKSGRKLTEALGDVAVRVHRVKSADGGYLVHIRVVPMEKAD